MKPFQYEFGESKDPITTLAAPPAFAYPLKELAANSILLNKHVIVVTPALKSIK